jgi:hypothetical protein
VSGNRKSREVLLNAIGNHPDIPRAAITGSVARPGGEDQYSDLDVLLVARDLEAVRDVRAWLPAELNVLICAFHLTNYSTVLLDSFEKFDFAIFSIDDPTSRWVVHDYLVIKGDADFEMQLATAAEESRAKRAAHLNSDVSIDNVLLLLTTAAQRIRRGEELSAHGFLAMAADMIVSLEKRRWGPGPDADLLDPRRRLEKTHGELARVLHDVLFVPPVVGIGVLAGYVSWRHRESMGEGQIKALEHLLTPPSVFPPRSFV